MKKIFKVLRALQEKKRVAKGTQRVNACPPEEERRREGHAMCECVPSRRRKVLRRSRNVWMRALQEKKDAAKVTQCVDACPPGEERSCEGHAMCGCVTSRRRKTPRRSRNV